MPWLTPIVFKQSDQESSSEIQQFGDGPKEVRFWHLLHAYKDEVVQENTEVQAITFKTIETAAKFAAPRFPASCIAITYPQDVDLVPPSASVGPPLRRDVAQVASFVEPRHLPLLFDVIRNGVDAIPKSPHPSAEIVDYVVLSNSDIHVQPFFYLALAEYIAWGYDVISVNRRTIDAKPGTRAFSPLYWADQGRSHPGFDCFIFPLAMVELFVESDCCCGAGNVMRSLLFNLVAHARRFLMLTKSQLTFHLGDDRYWAEGKFSDYKQFNMTQARTVAEKLSQDAVKAKKLRDFILAHEHPQYH